MIMMNYFPNGLPDIGQEVEIRTIWDKSWQPCVFRGLISRFHDKGRYNWFGTYEPPSVNSLPIVIEWRSIS